MKLAGRAWLEFEIGPQDDGTGSVIRQTAVFEPVGLGGCSTVMAHDPYTPGFFVA
jgi:hypothetical protein